MSSTYPCASQGCSKPGKHRCSVCLEARYCSKECQKTDWKAHKLTCSKAVNSTPRDEDNRPAASGRHTEGSGSSKPTNCCLIRAAGTAAAPLVEPFPMSQYGTEAGEKRELQTKLGWRSPVEAGKFYDHVGADQWYYYVYANASSFDASSGQPKNEAASLVCFNAVYGDVAVVRSGPLHGKYPVAFSAADLRDTLLYYRTANRSQVFAQREQSRMFGGMGLGGMAGSIPSFHLHL